MHVPVKSAAAKIVAAKQPQAEGGYVLLEKARGRMRWTSSPGQSSVVGKKELSGD